MPKAHPPSKSIPQAIAALGIVFGDIGTSPLYAFKECLSHGSSRNDVIGIVSLILWSLLILISVKYVNLVLRADNQGEGGILALLNLAFPESGYPHVNRTTFVMTALGLLGAALLYGDGVITPAISVLSSVEGLTLVSPAFTRYTVPLTVFVLTGLFAVQRKGSGSVGRVFGAVMLSWFLVLAGLGLGQVVRHPEILLALNPLSGIAYLGVHAGSALLVLGSVFLAVTGGEALYADLGHFGRVPISMAWNFLVLPSLALNYLGQGALVLSKPDAAVNPFFLLAPGWALMPLVLLSTAATVIASQALISGVFSLTMQASQMGFLPRFRLLHTNETESGQIYIPSINYALGAACVALVVGFRSSSGLASAYGVAVTLTMLTTTTLFYFACRKLWNWAPWKAGLVCGLFAALELGFFASNALKILHGGWLPLSIGAMLFYLMTTWKMGRLVIQAQSESAVSLEQFVTALPSSAGGGQSPRQVPGTAMFLTSSTQVTPGALVQNLKHNHVFHERTIVLTILTDNIPRRDGASRLEITPLARDFFKVVAHFGFMEYPTIGEILECCARQEFALDEATTSFFLGGQILIPTRAKGLSIWREHAFRMMSRNAPKASEFLRMPCNRTIEIQWQVEI